MQQEVDADIYPTDLLPRSPSLVWQPKLCIAIAKC